MIGTKTAFGASRILSKSGSNQCVTHSQCASRKTKTSPFASRAPANLALISPNLKNVLKINFIKIYLAVDVA